MRPSVSTVAGVSAVALATVLGLTSLPAEAEQRSAVVDVGDPRGDVAVTPAQGATEHQRQGIDLRHFRVVPGGDSVRIVFRIRHVTTSPDLLQGLRVVLRDADPGSPAVSGDLVVYPQHPRLSLSHATIEDEDDSNGAGVDCGGFTKSVNEKRGIVKAVVAHQCIPPGLLRLRVTTLTLDRDRQVVYSRDSAAVPGTFDLGGTAGSENSS